MRQIAAGDGCWIHSHGDCRRKRACRRLTLPDFFAIALKFRNKDADIMVIGSIPDKLKDEKRIDLLVQAAQSSG